MKKGNIKLLNFIWFISMIVGMLLIISLLIKPDFVDPTVVLGTPQMLFILFSALILLVAFGIIIYVLRNDNLNLLNLYKLGEALPKIEKEEPKQENKDIKKEEERQEETNQTSRFYMLTEIDKQQEAMRQKVYQDEITLERLCIEFRDYAASQLKLYYDIEDIRRFIGGLSVSHIMILQGMSGTGKTSLAYAFGDYLNNPAVIVPIQPMWKERTDLIGYYNEFTKRFNETTLLQKLYEANQNEQLYVTVLDEMNIARVEYYFAEFLSLLELPDHDKRKLDVIPDVWENDPEQLREGKLRLPSNMWFIGTANNDDSTFSISDKVYDRAMVINLDKKARPYQAKEVKGRSISYQKFQSLIDEAQKTYELTQRNLRRLKMLDQYLIEQFQITFGNRIMEQIKRYVPIIVSCGGSELDALDDMMSKKVLRKLETKNMVYVKSAAPGLIKFIEELFGEDEMRQCIDYINQIEINA